NCIGGSGASGNSGVFFGASLSLVNGSLNFRDCVGGTGSGGSHDGVFTNLGTITAPSIIAADCFGGNGGAAGGDVGFFVSGSTIGTTGSGGTPVTNLISITAGSLGVASNEIGIE